MACGRVTAVALIALSLTIAECKVYTRCQLTRELLKNGFSRTFLSNWVCLVEQESERNTSAFHAKTARRKYYGLFQIGSEYCKEGRKGGKCDISCEALVDEDIRDDGVCALKVFELEGFKYWPRWEARCKGQSLPDIENKNLASMQRVHLMLSDSVAHGHKQHPKSCMCVASIENWIKQVKRCPDWQYPSNRVSLSPPRDKRTLRGRRSASRRKRLSGLLSNRKFNKN